MTHNLPFVCSMEDAEQIDARITAALVALFFKMEQETGINKHSLALFGLEAMIRGFEQVDTPATVNLLNATARMIELQKNLPALVEKRGKAMKTLLDKISLLETKPQGSA